MENVTVDAAWPTKLDKMAGESELPWNTVGSRTCLQQPFKGTQQKQEHKGEWERDERRWVL